MNIKIFVNSITILKYPMGNNINKKLDVFSKNLIEHIFKMPKDFMIFFKDDDKDEILFKMEVHKIVLFSLPTPYFSQILQSDGNNFILTIPKVNAEIPYNLLCEIYEIKNNTINSPEKLFWKYYLQLYLLHRYFCFPNSFFEDLCILFYGYDIYHSNILLTDKLLKAIPLFFSDNFQKSNECKLCLPRHLKVSEEDFDLLLYVVELIGYDDYSIFIIFMNMPSDYESRMPKHVLDKLFNFSGLFCRNNEHFFAQKIDK